MTLRTTGSFLLLLALAFVAAPVHSAEDLPRTEPEAVGLSSARLERLTETMQAYVEGGDLAGGVVLVARHGRVAYLKSFGQRDIEAQSPMTNDAIFRIASQTKAIVSAGVMLLQEDGKLLISDPVGRHLPEFTQTQVAVARDDGGYDVVDARGSVTIRQLLTHTSGVSYGNGPASDRWEAAGIQGWYFADRHEPVADTIERVAALPFDAHPGEQWIYGYNTDILGALIEAVSERSLDDFLRTRIFEPLGMADTHFYLPRAKRGRLATVYSSTNEGLERAPNPGHMVGQGAYVDGPRTSFSGGPERWRTRQHPTLKPQDDRTDDNQSPNRPTVQSWAGLRTRVLNCRRCGCPRTARINWGIWLGGSVSPDLLGRPQRTAGRRLSYPVDPSRRA